jgi:DedD protein
MPFFNFRRGGSNTAPNAGSAAQTESVEVMRKRAKHRLIGSAVLVLIGVVGFPLLFDTQPRPIPVDIPSKSPARARSSRWCRARPPQRRGNARPVTNARRRPKKWPPTPAWRPRKKSCRPIRPAQAASAPAAIKNEAKPSPSPKRSRGQAGTQAWPSLRPNRPPSPPQRRGPRQRAAQRHHAAAAKPAAAEAEGRLVVQVGAFADVAKAREARLKLEKAGLKTYTQVAETKDGKRIRVRVGPFATKAEAEKAAGKIKALDLPAAILTL